MKKKQISKKVLETLVKLKNNGIKICIATGRSPIQVPHFPDVEFDAFLTYNGSYCFNKYQDIFSNPLKKEDVYIIINNAINIIIFATPGVTSVLPEIICTIENSFNPVLFRTVANP